MPGSVQYCRDTNKSHVLPTLGPHPPGPHRAQCVSVSTLHPEPSGETGPVALGEHQEVSCERMRGWNLHCALKGLWDISRK